MGHSTKRWRPSDALTMDEVTFLIDLYDYASGDPENIALMSDVGGAVEVVDISSQFDGVATTFTVPSYSSIKLFIITGWPPNGALRPTVDFTTPNATHVALETAEVSAPEAGTTGMILYSPT